MNYEDFEGRTAILTRKEGTKLTVTIEEVLEFGIVVDEGIFVPHSNIQSLSINEVVDDE